MAAQGEIDVFGKLVARTTAGKIANAEQIDGLEEMIASAIQPVPDKEVISVLTYSETAPATAEDGDYYINSSDNKLYAYDEGAWGEETPDESAVYITADTSHIYVWNGTTFTDTTHEPVDGTIYVKNLDTGLEDYTEAGLFTVCHTSGSFRRYYTMVVSITRVKVGPRITSTTYKQLLHNNDGYITRSKVGSGEWSDWEEFIYVSKKEFEELKPLIYAGL